MKTDRNSFISAASPARSETTSTGMPSGSQSGRECLCPGSGGEGRRAEPLLGHGPEQRDVGEPAAGDRGELLLQRRGGGVEIRVDRPVAERGQCGLGSRHGSTRSVGAQHDVGARHRLLRRRRRAAAARIGVVSANVGARRGEIRREPAPCLAQTEHGNRRALTTSPSVGPPRSKTGLLTIFATIRQYACRPWQPATNYEALRDAIVRGELAPNARLVESDISSSFEMSRGAVRTALIRLEQEGLVVREPHRGARVRPGLGRGGGRDPRGPRRSRRARRPAGGRADRRGGQRASAGMSRAPARAARGRRPPWGIGRERRPPRHAARALGTRHGRSSDRALNSQSVRYQYRTILIPGRSAASVAEHAAIVEAVVAGRPGEAESAMRTHLFNVAQAVQQGLLPGGIDKASRGIL